jgi:hypothetical protein
MPHPVEQLISSLGSRIEILAWETPSMLMFCLPGEFHPH